MIAIRWSTISSDAGDPDAADLDLIFARFEADVVTDAHRRHNDAQFGCELFADVGDAVEQVAALVGVDQRNEAVADFQTDRIDLEQIFGAFLRGDGFLFAGFHGRFVGDHLLALRLADQIAYTADHQAEHHECERRHSRHQTEDHERHRGNHDGARLTGELVHQVCTHVGSRGGPGDDDTGGGRNQQGRNLRHQTVTDRQKRVSAEGFGKRHTVHGGADDEAADDVDERDENAGDGVAAHEL